MTQTRAQLTSALQHDDADTLEAVFLMHSIVELYVDTAQVEIHELVDGLQTVVCGSDEAGDCLVSLSSRHLHQRDVARRRRLSVGVGAATLEYVENHHLSLAVRRMLSDHDKFEAPTVDIEALATALEQPSLAETITVQSASIEQLIVKMTMSKAGGVAEAASQVPQLESTFAEAMKVDVGTLSVIVSVASSNSGVLPPAGKCYVALCRQFHRHEQPVSLSSL